MRRALPIVVAMAVVLAGCAAPDYPQVLSAPDSDGVILTAEVVGNLVVINDTCYGLSSVYGNVVAIFPAGTTSSDLGITIPEYGDLAIGDRIRGAGAYLEPVHPTGTEIPQECATQKVAHLMDAVD